MDGLTEADADNHRTKGSTWGAVAGWLVALALLAGGAAAIVVPRLEDESSATAKRSPGPLVEVARPEAVGQGVTVRQTAFLRGADAMQVVSEVPGRVVRIGEGFARGVSVAEGALLFALDDETYRNDVARARARVRQAEARRDQAGSTLSRQQELENNDFASEATLDEARTAQAQAEGDLALAEAQLRSAQIALDDTEVRAPYDALVTAKDISQGEFVQAGTPAGRIVRADFAELRIGLSERQYTLLGGEPALMGTELRFTPRRIGPVMVDLEPRRARVTSVSPVIDEGARVIEVTARVDAPFAADAGGPALQINQLVTAIFDVPGPDRPLYAAPLSVLQAGNRIWRVEEGVLQRLPAEILRQTDERVFFAAEGFDGGELLVTPVDTPVEGLRVRVSSKDGAEDPQEDAEAETGDGS